jgi:hypothetical protein
MSEGSLRIEGSTASLSPCECSKIREVAENFVNQNAPAVEIGSHVGISTVHIGAACKKFGNVLFAVDHHRGSKEHQTGMPYYNSKFDEAGRISTFKTFMDNIRKKDLEDTVVPIVSDSNTAARKWFSPISFLFIDGDHSYEQVRKDFLNWEKFVLENGCIAMHDVDVTRKHKDSYEGPRRVFFEAVRKGYTPMNHESSLVFLLKGPPERFGVTNVEEILKYEEK